MWTNGAGAEGAVTQLLQRF